MSRRYSWIRPRTGGGLEDEVKRHILVLACATAISAAAPAFALESDVGGRLAAEPGNPRPSKDEMIKIVADRGPLEPVSLVVRHASNPIELRELADVIMDQYAFLIHDASTNVHPVPGPEDRPRFELSITKVRNRKVAEILCGLMELARCVITSEADAKADGPPADAPRTAAKPGAGQAPREREQIAAAPRLPVASKDLPPPAGAKLAPPEPQKPARIEMSVGNFTVDAVRQNLPTLEFAMSSNVLKASAEVQAVAAPEPVDVPALPAAAEQQTDKPSVNDAPARRAEEDKPGPGSTLAKASGVLTSVVGKMASSEASVPVQAPPAPAIAPELSPAATANPGLGVWVATVRGWFGKNATPAEPASPARTEVLESKTKPLAVPTEAPKTFAAMPQPPALLPERPALPEPAAPPLPAKAESAPGRATPAPVTSVIVAEAPAAEETVAPNKISVATAPATAGDGAPETIETPKQDREVEPARTETEPSATRAETPLPLPPRPRPELPKSAKTPAAHPETKPAETKDARVQSVKIEKSKPDASPASKAKAVAPAPVVPESVLPAAEAPAPADPARERSRSLTGEEGEVPSPAAAPPVARTTEAAMEEPRATEVPRPVAEAVLTPVPQAIPAQPSPAPAASQTAPASPMAPQPFVPSASRRTIPLSGVLSAPTSIPMFAEFGSVTGTENAWLELNRLRMVIPPQLLSGFQLYAEPVSREGALVYRIAAAGPMNAQILLDFCTALQRRGEDCAVRAR